MPAPADVPRPCILVTDYVDDDLLRLHGVGPKAIRMIRELESARY
jgi:hypothetical protein